MEIFIDKINTLKIPDGMKKDFDNFLKEVIETFSTSLVCGFVYGAAVKNEFIEGVSALNVMIVVEDLDVVRIEKIADKAKKYQTKADIVPRFLSKKNVLTGLDVFAIDYLEIKKDGVLIFGENILKDQEILEKHIVFQLERDIKAMRMKIIQAFWRSIEKVPALRKNLFVNLRQLMKLLAVTLDLKKIQFKDKKEAVSKASELIGFNPEILSKLLKSREDKKTFNKNEIILYTRNIFTVIAKMDDYFDKWNK